MLDMALGADGGSILAKQVKRDALLLLDHQTGGRNLWERAGSRPRSLTSGWNSSRLRAG